MIQIWEGKFRMCYLKGYVVDKPTISMLTASYSCNELCRFFLVKDSKEQLFPDIYPIVCFGKLASEAMKNIKPDDCLKIKGMLKDYNYKDYNFTSHYTKVFIAESFEKIDGSEITYLDEERVYESLVKNDITVVDITKYEKYEKMLNDMKSKEVKAND